MRDAVTDRHVMRSGRQALDSLKNRAVNGIIHQLCIYIFQDSAEVIGLAEFAVMSGSDKDNGGF